MNILYIDFQFGWEDQLLASTLFGLFTFDIQYEAI